MADETTPVAPRRDSEKSGFSRATPVTTTDSRLTGGSGVQRSHLRDRKNWLKKRTRAGRSWAQRKAMSTTYCPTATRRNNA
jgi:transposase InsO family protein